MATKGTNPSLEGKTLFTRVGVPARAPEQTAVSGISTQHPTQGLSQRNALQTLLTFSALHEQARRRKALTARRNGLGVVAPVEEQKEQFVLDEVLQLVAERAVAITGADGVAIALAEGHEIILRATAGIVRPDIGECIDRDSAFSWVCFRLAQVVSCDDSEKDVRVNLHACRRLGARSIVAVPLCGRRGVIGLLEVFSKRACAFNESDVGNLRLLAELVAGALKPEDEDRLAESAQAAAAKLELAPLPVADPSATVPTQVEPTIPADVFTKPVVAEITHPPVTGILDELGHEMEETPQFGEIVAAESTAEPDAQPKEPESAGGRPRRFILLLLLVVVVTFAAGVWLNLRTAQWGGPVVRTKRLAKKPASAGVATNVPTAPPSAPAGTAANRTKPNPEVLSDAGHAANSGGPTLQELSKFSRVTGIRHWAAADSSTVVLDLEDQVQYEAHRLAGPDRIYVDLQETQLVPDLAGKSIKVGDALLKRIRVAQPVPGVTRIVLETMGSSNFSVSLEVNPYRLVVELRKIGANEKESGNLLLGASGVDKNKLAVVILPPTGKDQELALQVPKMRIAVDAGHGGWDLGTVGRGGLLEKDLTLEIAQRLGKLLQSRLGMEVIYTRHDDSYIPLDKRADIANQAQGELFVSIHANYSDSPSVRGVETYYANFSSLPDSKHADVRITVRGARNAVTQATSPADLRERVEQSRLLGTSVQRSLYDTLSVRDPGLRDRGIKEASFAVLTGSTMPGILVEISFVSSPTDEERLQSAGYREQIAEALYKGIAQYASTSRAVKVATVRP